MRAAVLLALVLLGSALLAGCTSQAGAPLRQGRIVPGTTIPPPSMGWAPLEAAKIRPGVMVHTQKGDCPSNFVFIRPDNTSVFVGTTAYCVRDLHVGSLASIGTNDTIAVLIYSSFETMGEVHETDADALNYNDFAVFRVDEHDRKWVNPTMLHYGGPVAIADFAGVSLGARVRTYANLSDGLPDEFHARESVIAAQAGSWAYLTYGQPTLPGQMGSGVTTPEGKAVGVVVSMGVTPNPGANGVARLDKLMGYAKEHAKLDMTLMTADLLGASVLGSTPSPQS
jgi:hypothetical protein